MEQKIIIDDREIYINEIIYDGEYYTVFLGEKHGDFFSEIIGMGSFQPKNSKFSIKIKEEPSLEVIYNILRNPVNAGCLEIFRKKENLK